MINNLILMKVSFYNKIQNLKNPLIKRIKVKIKKKNDSIFVI